LRGHAAGARVPPRVAPVSCGSVKKCLEFYDYGGIIRF
jgi:hypothetical protein